MTDPISPPEPPASLQAPVPSVPTQTPSITPPRTRWAAIVWGTFFAALAGAFLAVLPSESRRVAVAESVMSWDAGSAIAVGVLAFGVVVLVAGIAALLRRWQYRAAESTSPR